MGQVLPKPELVPFNRVAAVDLQHALEAEYSKSYWREATRQAMIRWQAEGHSIQKVTSNGRRPTRYLVEE